MAVQALWRQVLLTALTDALHAMPANANFDGGRDEMSARDYVLVPNADFALVCHLAGVEPSAVRRHVQRRLAQLDGLAPPSTWGELTAAPKPAARSAPTYTYEGRTLTLHDWAAVSGKSFELLSGRVHRLGWPIERALTEPIGRRTPKPSRADPAQVTRIARGLPSFGTEERQAASSKTASR